MRNIEKAVIALKEKRPPKSVLNTTEKVKNLHISARQILLGEDAIQNKDENETDD